MRSSAGLPLAGLAVVAFCIAATTAPAPSPAPAPTASGSSGATLETPNYKLDTAEIHDKANGDFTMPQKVTFSRPGSDGTADRAAGNRTRGTVTLFGHVVIHDNGKAPEADSNDEYSKGGPATLTCDQLDVDSKAKIYTATGHVHYEQGTRLADAQRGVLNRTTGLLHLEGDVRTSEGASSMKAQTIDYNTITKHVEAVHVLIKQPVQTPEPGSGSPSPKPKKRRIPF